MTDSEIEITADPRVIDDLRGRLRGVAVSWKKVG